MSTFNLAERGVRHDATAHLSQLPGRRCIGGAGLGRAHFAFGRADATAAPQAVQVARAPATHGKEARWKCGDYSDLYTIC